MHFKSFIQPDEFRSVLHNFSALGRTNVLHHLVVSPSKESMEGLLTGVFAKTFSQNFSSLEEAQEFLYKHLESIHPLVFAKYEKQFVEQDSVRKIQDLAKTFFRSAGRDAQQLASKVKADIGNRILDKNTVVTTLEGFWSPIMRGRQPKDVPLKEYIISSLPQLFPFLSCNGSIDASELRGYLENCREAILQLSSDEDIKKFAEEKYEAVKSELSFISKTREQKLEEAFGLIWARVLEVIQGSEASSLTLQHIQDVARTELQLFPIGIQNLYLKDLSLAKDIPDAQGRIEGYRNDSISAHYTAGIKSTQATSAGTQGSPKIIDLQRRDRLTGFMKYVSGSQEMQIHRLYKFLLEKSAEIAGFGLGFRVPLGGMLEFLKDNRAIYTNGFGSQEASSRTEKGQYVHELLSWMTLANTKRDFSKIEQEVEFQKTIEKSPIAFLELVRGSNLSEFFLSQYLSLSTEKKGAVFRNLGMIAFFDFLIGNQDRLIRLGRVGNESFSEVFRNPSGFSNVANVMISSDATTFHVIDNVLGDGLAELKTQEQETEERNSYDDFLREMLCLPDLDHHLVSRFLQSLHQTFIDMRDECDLDDLPGQGGDIPPNLLIKELAERRLDIGQSVQEGIAVMRSYIKDAMIPIWNSSEADEIKRTMDPNLVDMVQKRLALYEAIHV